MVAKKTCTEQLRCNCKGHSRSLTVANSRFAAHRCQTMTLPEPNGSKNASQRQGHHHLASTEHLWHSKRKTWITVTKGRLCPAVVAARRETMAGII